MAQKTYLSPVDWSLVERLVGAYESAGNSADLADALERENYYVSERARLMVDYIDDGHPGMAKWDFAKLMGLRAAPERFALPVAELLLDPATNFKLALAELGKAEAPYMLFDPQYLLLAYVSPTFCRAFMGERAFEGNFAPYDGPEFLAAALGGAHRPDTPYRAMNAPDEVARIAAAFEGFDPDSCQNSERSKLLDYFEEQFGTGSDIGDIVGEQVETLCRAYSACASTGEGMFIELH